MKKNLMFCILLIYSMQFFAQSSPTISGTIVDATSGVPLPGASILLKNTLTATMADVDGAFVLQIPPAAGSNATLVISLIGYKPAEIPIGKHKVLRITLEEDIELLNEVVVVGHTTQKKGSVIGAVESVQVKELAQPTRSISTSLAGRLAGVIAVQTSGEPGNDSAEFWIRGVNTFTGTKTPLVLVDGIERKMDDVDPQEIESFTILKDATNTAVYGVRGGNGVVLITTKKGVVGKPKISLRTEVGFSNPLDLPKFADGATYMRVHNEALRNESRSPLFTKEQIERTASGYDQYYYPDVNWFDELIRNWSPTERVNVNVQGGSETIRYFVSAAFLNQNGMFNKFDEGVSFNNNIFTKRYNFRTNIDANLSKTTILSLNMAAILEDRNYPGTATKDIFSNMLSTPPIKYPLQLPDKSRVAGDGEYSNPYRQLARSGYTTEHHTRIQSNFSLTQNLSFITDGLQAKGIFSFDNFSRGRIKRVMNPRPYMIDPYGFDENGYPILQKDGEYQYKDMKPSGDYYDYLNRDISQDDQWMNRNIYIEAQIMYNKSFGKHDVGGLFLYNQTDLQDVITKDLYTSIPRRNQGVTGRASYAYDEKYFGEFNFGYNGSENFTKGKRYGFFPAAAVGWVPTKENFMGFLKPAIDYMKLRFSYGEVGNDNLGDRFVFLTRVEAGKAGNYGFGTNNGFGFGSGKGTKFTYFGNESATWETAKKMDLGLELKFLKDFSLQVDYFHERRINIWTTLYKTPDILGFGGDRPGANVGEMKNGGVDGMIEYTKQVNKDLMFNLRGTFIYAKNEVVMNGVEDKFYAYQSQIGQPDSRQLGYLSDGYFIDAADVAAHPDQTAVSGTTPKPGDLKYKDYNGDGVIDEFDRVYLGHPQVPEITYGISGGVVYKKFDFSFLFQGATNVSFYAKPKLFGADFTGNIYEFMLNDYWDQTKQNLDARFPRLGVGAQSNNYANSDHWLVNGSYLRLKQAELGYTLSSNKIKNIGISSVRIFANGNNLFTLSPFKWWDAESKNETGSYYPIQRIINFGVEVKF